ncbi:porin [Paraburkholderia caribensis]|uniref:porin n=1 Tax=Paraburkholderia caribensis TaxID=75105 RepID=UPI001D07A470|nr:porin [Paraburkholderia caribensis]
MKSLAPVVIMAASTLPYAAHAQSSVTLYGIIDEGINYNSNSGGHPSYAMQSGVAQGNRFGLRGTEGLGAGWRSVFVLENGFDVSNGKLAQGGLLFGRQAYVGVSNLLLTVTVGRQYDIQADFIGPFAASRQWAGNIGAHPGDIDNFINTVRTNNSIKVVSASVGGLIVGGMYSLGGVAGDPTRNQSWSVGATYANGPFSAGAGYLNVRDPNVSYFGNATSGTATATIANSPYPVYSGYLSAHSFQVASAGLSYKLGRATASMVYSNAAFIGLGDLSAGPNPHGYTGSVHFSTAEASLSFLIDPQVLLGAAFAYTAGSSVSGTDGHSGARYKSGSIGAQYFLSKRTSIYVLGVYQAASGVDSLNQSARASINNQPFASTSDRQAVIRIAMSHKF